MPGADVSRCARLSQLMIPKVTRRAATIHYQKFFENALSKPDSAFLHWGKKKASVYRQKPVSRIFLGRSAPRFRNTVLMVLYSAAATASADEKVSE